MKGKRYTTEEKIRMLRQADKGKTILEVCRENNISEQTFDRWKREFGMIHVNQAKRMLADKLQEPLEKTVNPGYIRQVAEKYVARG